MRPVAQRSQSKAKGWQQPVLLLLRLLIVGAALGVITGTVLKWLAPQLNTDIPLPAAEEPQDRSPELGSFTPKAAPTISNRSSSSTGCCQPLALD